MKSLLITMLLAFCCLMSIAQTKYEVTVNTFLNVRSYADVNAPVLGTVRHGEKIEVYEITDKWAKISFADGYAYVSSAYIKEVGSLSDVLTSSGTSFEFDSMKGKAGDVRWMVFAIVILSAVLFGMRRIRGNSPLEGGQYIVNCCLFLIVSILEIVYVLTVDGNTIWFCTPDHVGWIWTIVNFLIFGSIVYNQVLCFFETLEDIEYNSDVFFDKRWGLYSWGGGIVLGIVSGIFFHNFIVWVLVAFLICQLIQLILIFKGVLPRGGIGSALLCTAVYLLGSVSTILILAHFMILLIIVLIGLFILSFLGSSSKSSSRRCCNNCSHYSSGYCHYHNCTIYDAHDKVCDNYN